MALMTSCRWSPSQCSRAIEGRSACRSLRWGAIVFASCFESCRSAHGSHVPVLSKVRWNPVSKPATVLVYSATPSSKRTFARRKPSEVARKLVSVKLEKANLRTLVGRNDEAQTDGIGIGGLKQSGEKETLKTCLVCQHPKLLEDYQKTSSSLDGRTETCRACIAAFIAKRLGREMGHLALSIEESWQRAKECSGCGQIKELRDFSKNLKAKSGINSACRACLSKRFAKSPEKAPVDTPLSCIRCEKVKAASEFAELKSTKTGRHAVCRKCQNAASRERHLRLKGASNFIPRLRKFCSSCKNEKPTTDFYRSVLTIDGYCPRCKQCHNTQTKERKRRLKMKKMQL